MFVIMGATGQVGGAVLETLKQRGVAVRVVSRDPVQAQGTRCRGRAAVRRRIPQRSPPPSGARGGLRDAGSADAGEGRAGRSASRLTVDRRRRALGACAARRGPLLGGRASRRGQRHRAGVARFRGRALPAPHSSIVFVRPGDFLENWGAVLPAAQGGGRAAVGQAAARGPKRSRVRCRCRPHGGGGCCSIRSRARASSTSWGPGAVPRRSTRPRSCRDCSAKPVTAVPSSRRRIGNAGLVAAGLGADYAEKLADLDEAFNAGRLGFPPDRRRDAPRNGDARRRAAASRREVRSDRQCDLLHDLRRGRRQRAGRRHLLCLLVLRDGGARPRAGGARHRGDAGDQHRGHQPQLHAGLLRHRRSCAWRCWPRRTCAGATSGGKLLLLGSLLYLVGTIGVTMVFNIPLNNALAAARPETAEAAALWAALSRPLDDVEHGADGGAHRRHDPVRCGAALAEAATAAVWLASRRFCSMPWMRSFSRATRSGPAFSGLPESNGGCGSYSSDELDRLGDLLAGQLGGQASGRSRCPP